MRYLSFSLVCVLVFLGPASGQGKKRKNPNPAGGPEGTAEDYAQLNQQKDVLGKILAIDPDAGKDKIRHMTIRFEYQVMEPNPNYRPTPPGKVKDYSKEYRSLQTQLDKASAIEDPNNRQQAVSRIQQQMQALLQKAQQEQMQQAAKDLAARQKDIQNNNVPFISVTRAKDFHLEIETGVIVRRRKPAMEYDDRGFIKEYTKAELEKLHLEDNKEKKKPGYAAKYEELMAGQKVVLGLTPARKDGKAGKDDDVGNGPAPTVRFIIIVEDIPNPNNVPANTLPKR